MCSIAGAKNPSEVEKMLEIMKYRAPDGASFFSDALFTIGMGRLKIIDLSDLPIPYRKHGYVLAYNGEIYNYLELKEELIELGHLFETKSDIEVVLEAYKEWGAGCLDKFNGMFAFVIYDGAKFFIARDIAGEKPLYYRDTPFAFASEAKALGWDCKEFPAAHYAFYEFGKTLRFVPYWFPFGKSVNLETAEEELENLLEDAIKIRTRADVPYGLYFSGGIDSTLISTFHKFEHKFTYYDKESSEDFVDLLPKIVWHLDYPIDSFTPYGLWKLAEEASKKVKVVLSGEGADELFGGYIRYLKPHFNYLALKKFPSYSHMFEPAYSVSTQGREEFYGNLKSLLCMGDRMASAFGIENRCPFLDRRIIDFAFGLPDELKINGLDTKVILRRILKKRMPDYVDMEKKGLFVNVNKWLGVPQEGFGKETYMALQNKIHGNHIK